MFIRKGMAFMKNSAKRTLIGALFALSLASCNIHIGPSNSPSVTSTEESSFSSSSVSEPDPTLDKLEFVLAPNGRSYAVRAKSKDETKGEVVIPSTYQGLPVTVVGDNGFAGCSGITSLYLPNTITIIEQAAFIDCTSLKEVRLGGGLTVIDKEAFRRCQNLLAVDIPDYVRIIGDEAFRACYALKEVTFGESLNAIGINAFSLTDIRELYFPESLTSIGNFAFSDCDQLRFVNIPYSVESVGAGAFSTCASLDCIEVDLDNVNYSSEDGVLYDKGKKKVVCYPAGKYVIEIPKGVTHLGSIHIPEYKRVASTSLTAWSQSAIMPSAPPPSEQSISGKTSRRSEWELSAVATN